MNPDRPTMHEVFGCLSRGEFEELLGVAESTQIEFKECAYNLRAGNDQVDLYSDIASLANARGGIIVIGVATIRPEGEFAERASRIVGIDRAAVSTEALEKSAAAHIHPFVRDLHCEWHSGTTQDVEVDLLSIVVEAQRDDDKPFLTDRSSLTDGGKARPWSVGWPTRNNAETQWESPARIQQLVALGLRNSAGTEVATTQSLEDEAQAQRRMLEDSSDEDDDWPTYVVQAVPSEAALIDDFFGTFKEKVAAWRGLRAHGFDLGLDWDRPRPEGARLVAGSSARRRLIVARSGTASAGGSVSPNFLGWGSRQPSGVRVVINPVVLVEFTGEFFRFADSVLGGSVGRTGWHFSAFIKDLDVKGPVRLRTAVHHQASFLSTGFEATTSSINVAIQGTGDWQADAYRLLGEIYGVGFGQPEAAVAFSASGRLDLQAIGQLET